MTSAASIAESIASQLRDQILTGSYQAGDRLPPERELAARLGVNRGSVREALKQLEAQQLVSIRQGGGAHVRNLDEASLEVVRHMLFAGGQLNRELAKELLDVEEMLLSGAARLALEHADQDELAHARKLVQQLADTGLSDDEHLDVMQEVLGLIAQASRNRVLRLAHNALDPLFSGRFREIRKQLRSPQSMIEPIAEAIDDAIVHRDGAAAEEAIRRLIRAKRERILAVLDLWAAERSKNSLRPQGDQHVR